MKNTPAETAKVPAPRTIVYEFDARESGFSYAVTDLNQSWRRPRLLGTLIRSGFISRHQGVGKAIFWNTVVSGATVGGMALLYGRIFGAQLDQYLPFVALGITVWGLLSTLVNEGAGLFLAASGVFSQIPIPKSIFALRMIAIAFLTFATKAGVVAAAILWAGVTPSFADIALACAGLLLLSFTAFWLALGLGVLGARFHDLPTIANVAMTFGFFVTPVFWMPQRLGDLAWVVDFNPLHHFLNIVRGPIVGAEDIAISFAHAGGWSVACVLIGGALFGLYSKRLSYWA